MREEDPGCACLRPSEQGGGSVPTPTSTVWPGRAVPLFRTGHLLSGRSLSVGLLPLPQGTTTVKHHLGRCTLPSAFFNLLQTGFVALSWVLRGCFSYSWTHSLSSDEFFFFHLSFHNCTKPSELELRYYKSPWQLWTRGTLHFCCNERSVLMRWIWTWWENKNTVWVATERCSLVKKKKTDELIRSLKYLIVESSRGETIGITLNINPLPKHIRLEINRMKGGSCCIESTLHP